MGTNCLGLKPNICGYVHWSTINKRVKQRTHPVLSVQPFADSRRIATVTDAPDGKKGFPNRYEAFCAVSVPRLMPVPKWTSSARENISRRVHAQGQRRRVDNPRIKPKSATNRIHTRIGYAPESVAPEQYTTDTATHPNPSHI